MDDDTKYRIEVNKHNLTRIISFVGVMDSKAKFILTLVLALTAYLVTQLGSFLEVHGRWGAMTNWAPSFFVLLDLMAAVCLCCFIAAAVKVLCVISPRIDQHSGRTSPLFFDTIAKMPIEDFKAIMKQLAPNDVIELLADQTYDNAKVVQQKTADVQQCVKLFLWGMASFFGFTIGRTILVGLVAQ